MAVPSMVCRDLVELITDYLDGALAPYRHAAVANHLRQCEGCTEYLRQLMSTVDTLASLTGVGTELVGRGAALGPRRRFAAGGAGRRAPRSNQMPQQRQQ